MKGFSRRQILKGLAVVFSGIGLGRIVERLFGRSAAQELDEFTYLPIVQKSPAVEPTATPSPAPPSSDRVVHVHSEEATYWDFGDEYYGDFVDQDVVNTMIDRGIMELTGASSLAQAWVTLIPDYTPGQVTAVKVNFNNCFWCNTTAPCYIDAIIHPINAVVRGLIQTYPDFDTRDIWVYDATQAPRPPDTSRMIPSRFTDHCLYSGVRFFDGGCNEIAGYTSTDPTAAIIWRNPANVPPPAPTRVTDVLVNATYLINIPIMKAHGGTAVTLSFKNHFGSIPNCSLIHDWVMGPYSATTVYNPLVDIYRNPHILGKTILTIGDGLFGNWMNNLDEPTPWSTFGDKAPNSLFFATDPVAIDCVMCDIIYAERSFANDWERTAADDYLEYAASVGLGTYERGDPWGSGYTQINYKKIEL